MKTNITPGMVIRAEDGNLFHVAANRGRFVTVVNLTPATPPKPGHNVVGFCSVSWLQRGELIAKNFKPKNL